jgi:dihydroorotase
MHDIILKEAEIVDPSQEIRGVGSVAIKDGKISLSGLGFYEDEAKEIYNMKGKIITPGLIDLHCHPVKGFTEWAVSEKDIGLNTGVTLLCDGGTSGAANFNTMRKLIIERSETDILCFLNLSLTGQIILPEIWDKKYINVDYTKIMIEKNRDIIKGIKVRAIQSFYDELGIKGIETAKKLSSDLNLPLMVHLGEARKREKGDIMDDFSRATVSLLEKGDIISHYLTWGSGGMIFKDGKVQPELESAHKRGVVLDSSHGLNHMSFTIAQKAIARGLVPTVISTDMAMWGLPVVQSLAVVMSKFLNMGIDLYEVIRMTTSSPAEVLGVDSKRGSLKVGNSADLTVFELVKGDYIFSDGAGGEKMRGEVLLEPRMVLKGGKIRPSYSRYHIPPL